MLADFSSGPLNSTFPYPVCAKNDLISDQKFNDFDHQAEQLKGCDQDYIQLSNGQFKGRFLSVELGKDLAFHFEVANQRLEQYVGFPSDMISLGLVFSGDEPFKINGSLITRHDLFLSRPGGEMHILSPKNGAVMAVCFNFRELQQLPAMANLIRFLENQSASILMYRHPDLTRRLREDVLTAINAVSAIQIDTNEHSLSKISTAAINCILGQLDLHIAGANPVDHNSEQGYFRICQQIFNTLTGQSDQLLDYRLLSHLTGFSRRNLQLASKTYLNLSPGQYSRTLRLNNARRLLHRGLATNQTIGEIAENTGFQNWSRFSRYYADLFGELPSETLSKRSSTPS